MTKGEDVGGGLLSGREVVGGEGKKKSETKLGVVKKEGNKEVVEVYRSFGKRKGGQFIPFCAYGLTGKQGSQLTDQGVSA